MKYTEIVKDLFSVNKGLKKGERPYALAHCVSGDFALAGGIALEFHKRYNIRTTLQHSVGSIGGQSWFLERGGYCLLTPVNDHGVKFIVANLITKQTVVDKPTYQSLEESLRELRSELSFNKVKRLAIPQIGCGIDGLDWSRVSRLIKEVMSDLDIEILVCKLS